MKKLHLLGTFILVFLLSGCISSQMSEKELDKLKSEIKEEVYNEILEEISVTKEETFDLSELEKTLFDDLHNDLIINFELNDVQLTELENIIYTSISESLLLNFSDLNKENLYSEIYNQIYAELQMKITYNIENLEDSIVSVVENKASAVVGVSTFLGNQIQGTGSAVIYKKENNTYYAVTNHHVIADGDNYEIDFENGTFISATLVGSDEKTDVAVLVFESEKSQNVASFASSSELVKGQIVLAVGNPLGVQYYGSVTFGIISGLERYIDSDDDAFIDLYTSYIQHDAPINPGNSGGALFNLKGEVIGINVMKLVDAELDEIGFSIPSDTVQEVINVLETNGYYARPSLGIVFKEVSKIHHSDEIVLPDGVTTGLYIMEIVPDSSVDGSSLQQGDIITGLDGNYVENTEDLIQYFSVFKIGDELLITYNHDGVTEDCKVILKERPNT